MSTLNFQNKLDRLADGELSREEYSELLTTLDHEEDGWKQCALAFLESQALRRDLRQIVAEPVAQSASPAQLPARSFHVWHSLQALALAACLGLAFWLGRGSVRPEDAELAVVQPPVAKIESIPSPQPEPWRQGKLTLVVNGPNGEPREMELPVVDGSYVDPRAFLSRSATIPPDVVRAIEQSGHKIVRHREFMREPVDAEHEVVVPVDRLRVVPVSHPMY